MLPTLDYEMIRSGMSHCGVETIAVTHSTFGGPSHGIGWLAVQSTVPCAGGILHCRLTAGAIPCLVVALHFKVSHPQSSVFILLVQKSSNPVSYEYEDKAKKFQSCDMSMSRADCNHHRQSDDSTYCSSDFLILSHTLITS